MKTIHIFLFLSVLILFSSCEKDEEHPIVGTWELSSFEQDGDEIIGVSNNGNDEISETTGTISFDNSDEVKINLRVVATNTSGGAFDQSLEIIGSYSISEETLLTINLGLSKILCL